MYQVICILLYTFHPNNGWNDYIAESNDYIAESKTTKIMQYKYNESSDQLIYCHILHQSFRKRKTNFDKSLKDPESNSHLYLWGTKGREKKRRLIFLEIELAINIIFLD